MHSPSQHFRVNPQQALWFVGIFLVAICSWKLSSLGAGETKEAGQKSSLQGRISRDVSGASRLPLGNDAFSHAIKACKVGGGLSLSTGSSVQIRDVLGEAIPLSVWSNSEGLVLRVSNAATDVRRDGMDVGSFWDGVSKFGQGLLLVRQAGLGGEDLGKLRRLLGANPIHLTAADEFDFFPVEIRNRDGARELAVLLTIRATEKASPYDDGIPAGLEVPESIYNYGRRWYLMSLDKTDDDAILYRHTTRED